MVFLYGITQGSAPLKAEVHWLDPSGALFEKILNRDDRASGSYTWHYYTSALATTQMQGRPGTWKVQLWIDDQLSGEYTFDLAAKPLPASTLTARAEQPQLSVGDRWIRSDGVFEVVSRAGQRIEYTLGATRRYYTFASGELERVTEAGRTLVEFDPPLPFLQFPLSVGKRWTYQGKMSDQVTGQVGPMENSWGVVAYEDVTTAAGTVPAFKVVSRTATYWYSPAAKTIVRLLVSRPSVFRDFELVLFGSQPTASLPPAPTVTIGGTLTPSDFKPYYHDSWAVVIGINQYKSSSIPRLHFATRDAKAIADALPGLGFSNARILLLENARATKAAIEQAIYGSISQMDKDDRLFVFFAGHGETLTIRGGQEGYLLPFDADPGNLPWTALPMTDLAQIGRRLPVKHVLFALDNCFSGYATRRDTGGGVQGADLVALTRESVVQILTAGTQGQPAIEDGGHGLFTRHLLKGLEGWADPDGSGLTALKLATFIQERVVRESKGQQTPQYGKLDGEGEFLFRPPRR